MRLPNPHILSAAYGFSELGLAIARRSGKGAVRKDLHSLGILWVTIVVSLACAVAVRGITAGAELPRGRAFRGIGVWFFAVGVALRWWAILYLGRLFTVDVAIASDHRLIDSGPYRHVRHPSYTGALLAFLGLGFGLGDFVSLLVLNVPILFAFLRRMRIEEDALRDALGDQYGSYCRRTKRLIPFVY